MCPFLCYDLIKPIRTIVYRTPYNCVIEEPRSKPLIRGLYRDSVGSLFSRATKLYKGGLSMAHKLCSCILYSTYGGRSKRLRLCRYSMATFFKRPGRSHRHRDPTLFFSDCRHVS